MEGLPEGLSERVLEALRETADDSIIMSVIESREGLLDPAHLRGRHNRDLLVQVTMMRFPPYVEDDDVEIIDGDGSIHPPVMRWRGKKVDCKVVDVCGLPHIPSESYGATDHNLSVLTEQIEAHQRDGWAMACMGRMDFSIHTGTPLDFPTYRIIFVRREVDGKPQDLAGESDGCERREII